MRVFGNVVQLMSRVSVFDILSNQFPISGSYGLASVFLVKLPIQEVMLPLFSLSGQSREYGQSVHRLFAPIRIFTQQFYESRHHIPAGCHQVAYRAGLDSPRPIGDIRHAHTALVQSSFQSSQSFLCVEESRICSSLVMRAVIAREYK